MARAALWIGDHVYGYNPHTDEAVSGTLVSLETSDFDGKVYATIDVSAMGSSYREAVLEARHLSGPPVCRRARPNLDRAGYAPRGSDFVTCLGCGRRLYGIPNDNADWGTSWTHKLEYVPARFR